MQEDPAIKVEHVSKTFKLPHEKNNSIKSAILSSYKRKKGYELQKALDDVSFEVKKGEFFGVIGRNGGGKSTLLKLLAGIYTPTKGAVNINGTLVPFIELGVGFNPELTGRENVFLNGALLGFNRNEMQAMYKNIVEFAELERFMDQKLKNYSSGMQVRLAFSIAIRAKADILLIDEVLAVGDENFQKKCIAVFEDLKRQGRTIVFVSHSMGYIKDFCDRVIVINKGQVVHSGNPNQAIDVYNKLNVEDNTEYLEKYNSRKDVNRLGNGGAKIVNYGFYVGDKKIKSIKTGSQFSVMLELEYKSDVKDPVIGVMFRKTPTEDYYALDNHHEHVYFGPKKAGDKAIVTMTTHMPLAPGEYYLTLSVIDARSSSEFTELDILDNVIKVPVFSDEPVWGQVRSATHIEEDAK